MMKDIDILLFDLQDAGTRVYTFIHTMAYCMEACASWGKRMVVLDRPNPSTGGRWKEICSIRIIGRLLGFIQFPCAME